MAPRARDEELEEVLEGFADEVRRYWQRVQRARLHLPTRQHTSAYVSIRQHTAAYAYDIGKHWQRVERARLDLRFAELPAAAAHEELLKDVHEVRVVEHLSSQP
jgi:hypothetical protein